MLMTMKSLIEAMRATAYITAASIDIGHHSGDPIVRDQALARVALLTPVVKGWLTEIAQELTSIGIQIHGGTGYVEETGAAQHMRDARILTIYEGTTGIQAIDLVRRKILADGGLAMRRLLQDIAELDERLARYDTDLESIRIAVSTGHERLEEATNWLLRKASDDTSAVHLSAFNYLMLAGTVIGAWQMGRAAEIAYTRLDENVGDTEFCKAKLITARFYATQIFPRSAAYFDAVTSDNSETMELPETQF
jgi:acyl-CoA dehydrogenase